MSYVFLIEYLIKKKKTIFIIIERKLAKLYPDLASANTSNDLCYDAGFNSCQAQFAVCQNDSINSEKFCQCPSTYAANYETQQCGK